MRGRRDNRPLGDLSQSDSIPQSACGCQPPLGKGAFVTAAKGVITLQRKHNTQLTGLARSLRKRMTREERHLWYDFLKNYPVRFLRQKVIDNYIVDFYCHQARLIVELDGSQHFFEKNQQADRIRTEHLHDRDLLVIRIPNNELRENFEGVCTYIDLCVKHRKEEDRWVK